MGPVSVGHVPLIGRGMVLRNLIHDEGEPMKTTRTAAIVVLATTVLLSALTPADSIAGQKSLVGSWIVDVMPDQPGPPPVRNIGAITSDQTTVNTDPELGTGYGIWKKTGPREFSVKFLTLIPTGHPFGEGTTTVTATLTVDKDGDTATGPFTTVFDAINFQATVTGTVVLTRITFDP
jgi:hypothetical protein